MNFRFVFVVTYGRSGSTLLNGILNTIPNACIRGENDGALIHIYRSVRALERARDNWKTRHDAPASPWYGNQAIDVESYRQTVIQAFIDSVLNPPADSELLGFKEIRYTDRDMSDREFSKFMTFINESFPNPCFIFNFRNPRDVRKSKWWRRTWRSRSIINRAAKRFEIAYQENREQSYKVSYDEYVADPSSLAGLFEFLGAPFDLSRIQSVLSNKHGY